MKNTRTFSNTLLLASCLYLVACGGGRGGENDPLSTNIALRPIMGSTVLSLANDTDTVTLAWLEAIDDSTPGINITF